MRENRKTLVGRVISDKMEKTVVVQVETRKPHPLYHRIIRRHKNFKAHDPNNEAHTGDIVRIIESRPISKDKHFALHEILQRGYEERVRPVEVGDVTPEMLVAETAASEGETEETAGAAEEAAETEEAG
jgi:small subunit ribosomal protein S17